MSPKVGCLGSLVIMGRFWVDGWLILSVVLRLDASVGSFSSVASLGLSSSLGHYGHQMLG
jgi:hypothetical protein